MLMNNQHSCVGKEKNQEFAASPLACKILMSEPRKSTLESQNSATDAMEEGRKEGDVYIQDAIERSYNIGIVNE
jgi:hypothetical protein